MAKEERKEEKTSKKMEKMEKTEPDLKAICMDDPETYEALYDTMFLTPEMIGKSSREVAEEAERREKKGDMIGAAAYYRMAGGLAIYEGDVEKAKEYYKAREAMHRKAT